MASFNNSEVLKNHMTKGSSSKFTQEEIDKICKSAEDGVELLIKNAINDETNTDGNPWIKLFENKDLDLKVYNSETIGCPIKKFKAICNINYPPKHVQEFISNNEQRLIWDRNVCNLTALTVLQEDRKKVILLRSATNKVGPIAGRDFIDTTAIIEYDDGSRVSGGAGIEGIGFPDRIGQFVRGFNQSGGGWYFQPIDNGNKTKVTYIIQCDLKGWFPALVINQVLGGSFVDFFSDLKKALDNNNNSK